MSLERYLAELSNQSKPITSLRSAEFSDLSPEEANFLRQVWERTEVERRRQIVHQLTELTESNIKLNFDSIFQICLQDPDAIVRSKAIQGLWECQDCALIKSLIEMLTKDEAAIVRSAAASALGKFALLAELQKLHPRHTAKIAAALLNAIDTEGEVEVKCRAMEAIAPLSLPRVKEIICAAYQSDNPKIRASSIFAMGKSCDPSWLLILLKELNNSEAQIRFEAARACGELGEEDAVSHVVKLIPDPDARVQAAAIKSLEQIGGAEAKQALYQYLRHPDEQVSQIAKEVRDDSELEEELSLFLEIEPG